MAQMCDFRILALSLSSLFYLIFWLTIIRGTQELDRRISLPNESVRGTITCTLSPFPWFQRRGEGVTDINLASWRSNYRM